jgi:hypothetical protein
VNTSSDFERKRSVHSSAMTVVSPEKISALWSRFVRASDHVRAMGKIKNTATAAIGFHKQPLIRSCVIREVISRKAKFLSINQPKTPVD